MSADAPFLFASCTVSFFFLSRPAGATSWICMPAIGLFSVGVAAARGPRDGGRRRRNAAADSRRIAADRRRRRAVHQSVEQFVEHLRRNAVAGHCDR